MNAFAPDRGVFLLPPADLPSRGDRQAAHLDALVEANIQFHWGSKIEDVERAAVTLRTYRFNPVLAAGLETKAIWMRMIKTMLDLAIQAD